MERLPRICPPMRWRLTSWLVASSHALAPDVASELRGALFSRMLATALSVVASLLLEIVVIVRHPAVPFIAWLAIDAGVLTPLRLGSAFLIVRYRADHPAEAAPPSLAGDCYILAGTLWMTLLGVGCAMCLAIGDSGVVIVSGLLACGVAAVQCGRSCEAPRLARVQIASLLLPATVGAYLSPDPLVRCLIVMVPLYVIALSTINRDLHSSIVEMMVSRQENRRLALGCPLTGLPNRRMFDRSLAAALAACVTEPAELFLLYLDLDGFKKINDQMGHPAGDLLLQHVAARLQRQAVGRAMAARLGGDEFAILLEGGGPEAAESQAKALVAALAGAFDLDGAGIARVTVSIGLARCDDVSKTAHQLMSEADQALYVAKRAGKNRFVWHDPPDRRDPACSSRRWTDTLPASLTPLLNMGAVADLPLSEPGLAQG